MFTPTNSSATPAINLRYAQRAYFQADAHAKRHNENILGIEDHNDESENRFSDFDSYLIELLTDLEKLKYQSRKALRH